MGWGVSDYPEPPEFDVPFCPICGSECETLYKIDGEIKGCDQCVDVLDAWAYLLEGEEE